MLWLLRRRRLLVWRWLLVRWRLCRLVGWLPVVVRRLLWRRRLVRRRLLIGWLLEGLRRRSLRRLWLVLR